MQKCCDLRASEDALEGKLEILNCILNKHFYRMSRYLSQGPYWQIFRSQTSLYIYAPSEKNSNLFPSQYEIRFKNDEKSEDAHLPKLSLQWGEIYSFEKLPAWNSVIQTVRSNGIYIYVNWTDKVYFLERGQFTENLHLLTYAEKNVAKDKILQAMTFTFNEYITF